MYFWEWIDILSAVGGVLASIAVAVGVFLQFFALRRSDAKARQVDETVLNVGTSAVGGTALAPQFLLDVDLKIILQRLFAESERLRGRSSWNLVVGFFFTFLAVGLLVLQLLPGSWLFAQPDGTPSGIVDTVRKFALAAVLQVVAFFFLRLYVDAEMAQRNVRNEVTTVLMRFAAARWAENSKDAEAIRAAIVGLSKADRAIVSRKGETVTSSEAVLNSNEIIQLATKLGGSR